LGDSNQWSIADEHYKQLRDAIIELLDLDLNHYRTQQMERSSLPGLNAAMLLLGRLTSTVCAMIELNSKLSRIYHY
jgi:hypothetical protein